MKKTILLFCIITLIQQYSYAQNNSVGIGTTTPESSSILELKADKQGFLVPRLDSAQALSILNPATGLLLFNIQDNCFWVKELASWKKICNTDAIWDSLTSISNYIHTLHDSIINNYQDITNIYDSLANHTYHIQNLYDSITNINTVINNYNDSLNNYYQYIQNLYDSVYTINQDIDNIYDSLHVHSTQINNIYDSLTVINNNINTINDSLTNYYQYFQNLYDSVQVIHQDISNIYDSLHNHTNQINNLYDSIQVINNDISALYDSIHVHSTQINNLFDSVSVINASLDSIHNHLISIDSTLIQKWDLNGNTGTNAAINFIGTKDSVDLVIRTHNIEQLRIKADGRAGVGTSNPDATAILDIYSNNKGLLVPRLTTAEINSIVSPANGLFVYNTTENCFYFFKSNLWKNLCDINFDSLIVHNLQVDSIIGNYAYFDSLFANYIYSDTIIAQYIQSDTAIFNAASINNLYNNLFYGDSVFANYANLQTVYNNLLYSDSVIANYIYSDTIIAQYIQSDTAIFNAASINNLYNNLFYGDSVFANYVYSDTIISNYADFTNLSIDGQTINNYTASMIDTMAWLVNGNMNVTASKFIGSINTADLVFKTDNTEKMRVLINGNTGINTNAPTEKLDVNGQIRLRTGATNNYILTSDINGVGTWTDPNLLAITDKWNIAGNSGTNPTNNYIGTSDLQHLSIRTNGQHRIFIHSGGFVGVNTFAPTTNLDVNGQIRLRTGATNSFVLVSDANGVGTWTNPNSLQNINKWDIWGNSGTNPEDNYVGTTDNADLAFRTNDTERLRILSTGFVGIGTIAPTQILDVVGQIRLRTGATNNYIFTSDANGVGTWTNPNSLTITNKWDIWGNSGMDSDDNFVGTTDFVDLNFRTNNTERLKILATGLVGIGTNAPSQALDINGQIRLRTGAANNYILTSDANGVGTWTDPNALTITNKWGILGNTGTNANTNFVGTTDNVDLTFRTNNTEKARLLSNGNFGINISVALAKLHVNNGSILFNGTTGSTPVSGAGIRLMWIPAKAAFRAGQAIGALWDDANIGNYSVAFGNGTTASGITSSAFGINTTASNDGSSAFGYYTTASGQNSIAFGSYTIASGVLSAAFGSNTTASGTNSFVVGNNSTATTTSSIALGTEVNSIHAGSFCFGDASSTVDLNSSSGNQMNMRFHGGYRLYSSNDLSSYVAVASGAGSWTGVSDKNVKENFRELNFEEVLIKLNQLNVSEWGYKAQNPNKNENYKIQPKHIGPMAQDFFAAFGLGETEIGINSFDIDGVNMAAIKGLINRTNDQAKTIEELRKEIEELKRLLKK